MAVRRSRVQDHLASLGLSVGENFVLDMDAASQQNIYTIAVLSPDYFDSDFARAEWTTAFQRDPTGELGLLLPIRVRPCDVKGLLGPRVYLELVRYAQDEAAAREALLTWVKHQRRKPENPPAFPLVSPLTNIGAHTQLPCPLFPGALPPTWMVPYASNPFFTGRDEDLKRLAEALRRERRAALTQPAALSGMGGVGKTQLAVEYAYDYRQDYQRVLWAQADSREALISGFAQIAHELELPQRDEKDQEIIVQAVRRWLQTHDRWLLILDNADDLEQAKQLLPPATPGGHILLTTRVQALGALGHKIEVEVLDEEQGALLLLRRVGSLAADTLLEQAEAADVALARAISTDLGGLPLALDQAGAYIEKTGCSLADYLALYQKERKSLLRRRGSNKSDHPESVTVTFRLAFEKVQQKNPVAADLLRLCAFLAPDAIPEEIITQGAEHLGPRLASLGYKPLLLNEAIAALRAYSLVQRDAAGKTLSVHRLVQAVLRDDMKKRAQRQWARKTMSAVDTAFPDVAFVNWPTCERLLPHALVWDRAEIAKEHSQNLHLASLLYKAGLYLRQRARYTQVEPLYQRALQIREQALGPEHPDVARSLNSLANLYRDQDKLGQAERLYERALDILEKLGTDQLEKAKVLNNLALVYDDQGKYEQAEFLFQKALHIWEQTVGLEHPITAHALNNLALMYIHQNRYEQAEPFYLRALHIWEQVLGPEASEVALPLNGLGTIYRQQGKYEQAESAVQRSLRILEQTIGPEYSIIAQPLLNMALIYRGQGKYEQAESLVKRSLRILEQAIGPENSRMADSLACLANLYVQQGKDEQAEPLYQRALSILQQRGLQTIELADILCDFAGFRETHKQFGEALVLYQQALAIHERLLGQQNSRTVDTHKRYINLLRIKRHIEKVEKLEIMRADQTESSGE